MGRALTTPLHMARHLLASSAAWFLFVEIPRKAGGHYRLVNDNRHVEANGCSWQAVAMEITLPEESAEGELAQARVRVPNISRVPMRAIELEDEILGAEVTFYLQHQTTLSAFVPALSWKHLVLSTEVNERYATFVCGHPAQTLRAPWRVYDRRVFLQLLRSGGISTLGGRGTT